MVKLLITRIGPYTTSQWEEENRSLKICASEHYAILKKANDGLMPAIRQVGKRIFLVLPKGRTCMVVEEV